MKHKPIVIVVEGVISSGKTSYICMLRKLLTSKGLRITVVKEPIDKWSEPGPDNSPSIFTLFNEDRKRWSYHFQTKVFYDKVHENKEMFEKYGDRSDVFICERSCFKDNIYMDTLREGGYVTELEMQHYKEWCSMWSSLMPYEPDLFIYLRPSLETCMKRIKERNRPGEEKIDIEYQRILQEKHDDFFGRDSVNISDAHFVPCIRLTTEENFRDNAEVQERLASHFEEIVKSIIRARKFYIL